MILVQWCLLLQAVAFSPTYAHLRMTSPEPYGSSRKTLDNSPLAADGSDFPCKISPGDFIVPTEEATYGTGSNNIIKLLGTATHGGGSCQVSLTREVSEVERSRGCIDYPPSCHCPELVGWIALMSILVTVPGPTREGVNVHFNFCCRPETRSC
jgi:hypothetical protein